MSKDKIIITSGCEMPEEASEGYSVTVWLEFVDIEPCNGWYDWVEKVWHVEHHDEQVNPISWQYKDIMI